MGVDAMEAVVVADYMDKLFEANRIELSRQIYDNEQLERLVAATNADFPTPSEHIETVVAKRLRHFYTNDTESPDDPDYLVPLYDVLNACIQMWKKHVLPETHFPTLFNVENAVGDCGYLVVTLPSCDNWLVHECLLGEEAFVRDKSTDFGFYGTCWDKSVFRRMLSICVKPHQVALGAFLRDKLSNADDIANTLQVSPRVLRYAFKYLPFQVQRDVYNRVTHRVLDYLDRRVPEEIRQLGEDPVHLIRMQELAIPTRDVVVNQYEYC